MLELVGEREPEINKYHPSESGSDGNDFSDSGGDAGEPPESEERHPSESVSDAGELSYSGSDHEDLPHCPTCNGFFCSAACAEIATTGSHRRLCSHAAAPALRALTASIGDSIWLASLLVAELALAVESGIEVEAAPSVQSLPVPSHSIPYHPSPSRPIPPHPIRSHPIPFLSIPSHQIPSIKSHPVPFYPSRHASSNSSPPHPPPPKLHQHPTHPTPPHTNRRVLQPHSC